MPDISENSRKQDEEQEPGPAAINAEQRRDDSIGSSSQLLLRENLSSLKISLFDCDLILLLVASVWINVDLKIWTNTKFEIGCIYIKNYLIC